MSIFEIFQNKKTGKLSSHRVNYIAWSFGLLGAVIYLTVVKGEFPKIDGTLVALYATVVTGKTTEAFAEKENKATENKTTGA